MNSIEKGNAGEKFVTEIANNSFMKYWCYPSPKDEKGDKKEICDLLIVFRDYTIIISVKNYEFKENYNRYFRRTIDKAVKQIYGAERKLFKSNRDIFIKHPDKDIEEFHSNESKRVHRIIINLGDGVKFYAFQKETKDEKFISIFDKEAFKTIVEELDTIPDFIEYLSKREELFNNKNVIILPGEEEDFSQETTIQFFEYSQDSLNPMGKTSILLSGTEHDLLAHYLKNERNFPEVLHSNKYNGMFIQLDGNWEEFIKSKQVIKKKELDKSSYFIDELVKREVLSHKNPQSIELAKELLSFDRFNRRMISDNFLQFYDNNKDNGGLNFARRYGDINGKGVAFAFYPPDMDEIMVNVLLEIAIDSFCIYYNYKSSSIIMIATTKDFMQFKIGMMKDIKPFTKEREDQIKEEVNKLGWFTNHKEIRITDYEYPEEE